MVVGGWHRNVPSPWGGDGAWHAKRNCRLFGTPPAFEARGRFTLIRHRWATISRGVAKVTLRQIAEIVGCTRSTVSYALRNNSQISAALRERIQQVAADLGWQVDAELTRQMAIVRGVTPPKDLPHLAIVINKSSADLANEVTPKRELDGARRRAQELGYNAYVFNLADNPLSPPRLRDIFRARGVQGVVFIGTAGTELSREMLLVGREFACAVSGIRYLDPAYHTAISDLLACGRISVLELARLGFRRVGVVLPKGLDVRLERAFYGGVLAGMVELPDHGSHLVHYAGDREIYLPDSSFPAIKAWMLREKPDVLLTTDLKNCHRFLETMPTGRRQTPVFALDWFEDGRSAGGVDALHLMVGAAATDLVIGQIHRFEKGLPQVRKVVEITGTWRLSKGFEPPAKG